MPRQSSAKRHTRMTRPPLPASTPTFGAHLCRGRFPAAERIERIASSTTRIERQKAADDRKVLEEVIGLIDLLFRRIGPVLMSYVSGGDDEQDHQDGERANQEAKKQQHAPHQLDCHGHIRECLRIGHAPFCHTPGEGPHLEQLAVPCPDEYPNQKETPQQDDYIMRVRQRHGCRSSRYFTQLDSHLYRRVRKSCSNSLCNSIARWHRGLASGAVGPQIAGGEDRKG